VHTQHEHYDLKTKGADLPQDRKAVRAGETQVHNHQPPGLRLDLSQGLFGSSRLAKEDVPVLSAKHLLQTLTNEVMIINNQYR
jgi:hypothetical protein